VNPPQSTQASNQTPTQNSTGHLPEQALSQRVAWLAMLLGTFLLAWLAAGLLYRPGNIALIWFANAWAMAIYLSRPTRDWRTLVALQALANLLWNWWHGDPATLLVGFALGNMLASVLAAALWRRFFTARQVLEQPLRLVQSLLLCGAAPALLGASLGAGLLGVLGTAPFGAVWPGWFLGDLFGYLTLAPATYFFLYHRTVQPLLLPRGWHALVLLAFLLGLYLVVEGFGQPYAMSLVLFAGLLVSTPPWLSALALVGMGLVLDVHLVQEWQEAFAQGQQPHPVQALLPELSIMLVACVALAYVKANQLNQGKLQQSLDERDEALSMARELLQTRDGLLHSAKIGLAQLASRTVRWCNQEYAEIHGYAIGEILGMTALQLFISEAEAKRVGELVYPLVSQGLAAEAVGQIRHKDGTARTVLIRAFRPDPKEDRTFIAVLDMTEREAQAQKIMGLQKEQQLILDTANVGLVRVRERKLVWVNRRCAELLGYTQQELQGQPTDFIFPDPSARRHAVYRIRKQIEAGQNASQVPFLIRLKDGQVRDFEAHVGFMDDAHEDAVLALRDVTDEIAQSAS